MLWWDMLESVIMPEVTEVAPGDWLLLVWEPSCLIMFRLHLALAFWNQTCNTLLESPVFWASCLRSLASGFWFIAK